MLVEVTWQQKLVHNSLFKVKVIIYILTDFEQTKVNINDIVKMKNQIKYLKVILYKNSKP